ncbi:MAG: hypothetical protein ICV54_20290 [Nostoc sp. C3-bin3]|nr:hypothetical protein [Nostoc sp. C3-bin3]
MFYRLSYLSREISHHDVINTTRNIFDANRRRVFCRMGEKGAVREIKPIGRKPSVIGIPKCICPKKARIAAGFGGTMAGRFYQSTLSLPYNRVCDDDAPSGWFPAISRMVVVHEKKIKLTHY